MAIKDIRIIDPDSGEVKFTTKPKSFKGKWYHPFEHQIKMDYYGGTPKKIERGYRKFRKLMQGWRSS